MRKSTIFLSTLCMYEVELKFKDNSNSLASFLKDYNLLHEKKTIDIYYDINNTYDFFHKGYFLRLREEEGDSTLDFKFDTPELESKNDHNFCIEKTFSLNEFQDNLPKIKETLDAFGLKSNVSSFQEMISQNNLEKFVTIEKKRKTYKIKQFTIVLDKVNLLGNYVEIEIIEKDQNKIEERIAEITNFASKFKLEKVKTGYVELYLKKFNPKLYKEGRFLDE